MKNLGTESIPALSQGDLYRYLGVIVGVSKRQKNRHNLLSQHQGIQGSSQVTFGDIFLFETRR